MSTIDEIMEAIQQAADAMDDCLDGSLRELIAAAIADAQHQALRPIDAEIRQQTAEIDRLKLRLKNILEAPSETLSDGKALKEMVRQAKLGLDGK